MKEALVFESLTVKFTLLEGKGDRNKEDLEKKIDRNREELERVRVELEKKIEGVRQELHTNFRWIVGIQITTWITILLAILFK